MAPKKKRKASRRGKGDVTKRRNTDRMVNFQMQKSPDMVDVKAVLVVALKSLGWSDEQFQPLEELLDDVHELHKAVADAEPSDADDADKLHPALKALPKPILRAFLSGYIRVHECAKRVPVPAPLPNKEKFQN